MPANLLKIRVFDKENLKISGLQLISHVMEEFKKEPKRLRSYVNEILHSIFFLGIIHKDCITPGDFILNEKCTETIKKEFPEPFEKYKTHLPKRTPFSVLLDMIQLTHGTKEGVMRELCNLMEKLEFPCPVAKPANKNQRYYTLESTVICVCSSSQNISDVYFGASLGCRTEKAKSIMIYSSCLNTWHDYVSYVVMSFAQNMGDSLQFPNAMQCQAYIRDWKENTYKERQPCKNCAKIFGLSEGTEHGQEFYPYGNCAETECLSKLLFNDQFMRARIKIGHFSLDKLKTLKGITRKYLREKLDSLPSININGTFFFNSNSY